MCIMCIYRCLFFVQNKGCEVHIGRSNGTDHVAAEANTGDAETTSKDLQLLQEGRAGLLTNDV